MYKYTIIRIIFTANWKNCTNNKYFEFQKYEYFGIRIKETDKRDSSHTPRMEVMYDKFVRKNA